MSARGTACGDVIATGPRRWLRSPRALSWGAGLALAVAVASLCLAGQAAIARRSWVTPDANFAITAAWRAQRAEGGLYVTAPDHKGPLWIELYSLALRAAGIERAHEAVAALATLNFLALGAGVGWLAWRATGNAWGAAVAALLCAAYAIEGPERWNAALYARNLTAAFTLWSFALAWRPDSVAGLRRAAVSGVLVGLAVQTMPTTAIPATVVFGLVAARDMQADAGAAQPWRKRFACTLLFSAGAAAAAAAAPLWYLARGEFQDFWTFYYSLNRRYGASGRSAWEHAGELAQWMVAYYSGESVRGNDRFETGNAAFLAVVAVFACGIAARWRRAPAAARCLAVALLAWWAAEWLAVYLPAATSRRVYDHYFVLPFVPMAAMGGWLVAWASGGWRPAVRRAGALVLSLAVLAASGALWREARQPFAARNPTEQLLREVVGAVSEPREFVYVWTDREKRIHLDLARPPASRYFVHRWLTGARASVPEAFAPEGAWEKWAEDVAASRPVAVLEFGADPIPADSPVAAWRDREFTELLRLPGDGGVALFLRNDRFRSEVRAAEAGSGSLGEALGRSPESRARLAQAVWNLPGRAP